MNYLELEEYDLRLYELVHEFLSDEDINVDDIAEIDIVEPLGAFEVAALDTEGDLLFLLDITEDYQILSIQHGG